MASHSEHSEKPATSAGAGRLQRIVGRLRCLAGHRRVPPYLFTIVIVALSLALVHSAFRKGGLWDADRANDFRAYHQAARAALGRDLASAYSAPEKPYQYPPTLASIVVPLGLLPARAALVLWVLGSLALLLWSFRVLERVLCPPVRGVDKFLGFLMVFRMIESDFANTNANTLVLGLIIWGFSLERRGRSGFAGVVIALATCIKVFPALLAPWMLYRARWRMTGGFLAGLVVWGALVPGTVLGPADFSRSFASWYRGVVAPMSPAAVEYGDEAPGGYLPGQSLRVLLHRVARPIDATAHDDEEVPLNVMTLSKSAVDMVWVGLAVVLLGGLMVFFRRRSSSPIWGGGEIAVALTLTVLLSPLARKAHFVVLLPAATYAFMLARISTGARRTVSRTLWWAALGVILLTSPSIIGDRWSAIALGLCPLSVAGLMLVAVHVIEGSRPELDESRDEDRPPELRAADGD